MISILMILTSFGSLLGEVLANPSEESLNRCYSLSAYDSSSSSYNICRDLFHQVVPAQADVIQHLLSQHWDPYISFYCKGQTYDYNYIMPSEFGANSFRMNYRRVRNPRVTRFEISTLHEFWYPEGDNTLRSNKNHREHKLIAGPNGSTVLTDEEMNDDINVEVRFVNPSRAVFRFEDGTYTGHGVCHVLSGQREEAWSP